MTWLLYNIIIINFPSLGTTDGYRAKLKVERPTWRDFPAFSILSFHENVFKSSLNILLTLLHTTTIQYCKGLMRAIVANNNGMFVRVTRRFSRSARPLPQIRTCRQALPAPEDQTKYHGSGTMMSCGLGILARIILLERDMVAASYQTSSTCYQFSLNQKYIVGHRFLLA